MLGPLAALGAVESRRVSWLLGNFLSSAATALVAKTDDAEERAAALELDAAADYDDDDDQGSGDDDDGSAGP